MYTPAVCFAALALAILVPLARTLLLGLPAGWSVWVYRALTFLVASCPCALVISIPLSFFAGIGGLLALGVGDTIRVSLTDDPVKEVYAAKAILKAVGRAEEGINVVSCPTCGRTRINLIDIAKEVEQRCQSIRGKKMKVAVMGCVVNGPGEAREADLGIAGGDGVGLIFRRGEIIKKVPQEQLVDALMDEIAQYEGE